MRRICMLLLVLVLFTGMLTPVSTAAFPDITDQTTQTAVTMLQNLGIVNGYPDGTFRPDENFSRAHFCAMAVVLSGTVDINAYLGFTIFPDVREDHWARAYINAAVRALKVVTGFPDGTFKPDIPINYAQAVTALMRLLGYTDSDVGLSWPHGYMNKASQIGLTKGINLGNDDIISRGLSALMFYNAIFTENKDGVKYSDMLGFTEIKVIVLQRNGFSPDGLSRGLVTIGGSGFYPYRSELALDEGSSGTLLVDKDGYALSWTPDKQTMKEVTVREIGPMSVTGADGVKVDNIPSTTNVYINGELKTWDKCWIDIQPGLALRFFFSSSGAVDYIILFQPNDDGDVKIISSEPSAGRNPLPSLGIDADALVFKNGVLASWSDLRQHDVLIYNALTNTVNATDFRITGIFEAARPSREAPDEVVTLGGRNFKVLPDVRPKLASSRIGDTMIFLFTPDGRVADVRTTGSPVFQPGIVAGDKSVLLYNGMLISGNEPLASNLGEGTPVLACMSKPGELNVQTVPARGSVALDIKDLMAGSARITPYAVIMDLSGNNGRAVRVDVASLPDEVAAASVLSVILDSGGRANLIVLRNVTGDALSYGFTTVERGRTEVIYDGSETIYINLPNLLFVDNQSGRKTFEDSRSLGRNSGSSIYGVAVGTNGNVISSQICVRVNNVRRSDFTGNTAVTVSGVQRPIPEGLMVYVQSTQEYISVAEARLISNNFSIFLDKPAADGGKPRFIVAL